jgi:hypothetical protein
MSSTRTIGLLLCGLAPVVVLTGCSGGKHSSGSPATQTPVSSAAAPTASPAARDPHAATAVKAPNLSARGIKVVLSGTSLKGQHGYSLPHGIKAGDTLAVAVNCQGAGKLLVKVQPNNISIPVACEKEIVPSLNEMGFAKTRKAASITFVPTGDVTWSFAAGWDPDPPEREN